MDCLGGLLVEIFKCTSSCAFSGISTLRKFHGNIESLDDEVAKLIRVKDEINESIRVERMEGKFPTSKVENWLKDVEKLEPKVRQVLLEAGLSNSPSIHKCKHCSEMYRRYQLSNSASKLTGNVKELIKSCDFTNITFKRKSPIRAVERLQVPSMVGSRAHKLLEKIIKILDDIGCVKIGVYGKGGAGKTLLVKHLNNKLDSSLLMKPFDMVIWISVTQNFNLKNLQTQIANRLNIELDTEENIDRRASRVLTKLLSSRKNLLLIFDDVWEKIDLDKVGVPHRDDQEKCKIVITTRRRDVCNEMMMDVINVEDLEEDEAWNLFAQNAGDVVNSVEIHPLAREIAKKCGGLPLAVKAMGSSLRNIIMIERWKDTLHQLNRSSLHFGIIKDEVYESLRLSFNFLPSKRHRWCFLYCSLFPENYLIRIGDLVHFWIGDGLIDENQTLEEAMNFGVTLIETLKDSSMLEPGDFDGTVKMHGVLRDFAIWISCSEFKGEILSQCNNSLKAIPDELRESFQRVSFANNNIARIPNRLVRLSRLTSLFLQDNPLHKMHGSFFQEVSALRVLNLSRTRITALPPSVLELKELRTLLLRDCYSLEYLPQLSGFCKLQMLDSSGTRIRELPEDIGVLSTLRVLNLSRTHHLENIRAGSILRLSSLEELDMSFSAFRWDVRSNAEVGRASFDELIKLERLLVLRIRMDTVDCLGLCYNWLKQLKQFNIRVGPRNCESNYLPALYDERRVMLRGVNILERGINELLCNASALDMVSCGGISMLSDIVSRKSSNGLPNLKSLMISSCDSIGTFLVGEVCSRTTLPNLESLTLSRLKNLAFVLDGIVQRGCLGSLKTIEVVDCPRLKNLVSFGLLSLVPNLEVIKVSDCERMTQLIISTTDSDDVLPKLRTIRLRNMPNLRSICPRKVEWPSLKSVEVRNCPSLVNLPLSAQNAPNIREIRGDLKWWNGLRWKDNDDELILQHRFRANSDFSMLEKEDRWA